MKDLKRLAHRLGKLFPCVGQHKVLGGADPTWVPRMAKEFFALHCCQLYAPERRPGENHE